MQKLQPKLRFPEFREELFKSHLGEIATFSKGKGISKNDITSNGKNECIRYGELYTTYGEVIHQIFSKTNVPKTSSVLSEFNDIIIPSSGETQLDIAKSSCVLKSDVILGGDLNIIKTKNNGVFFSYYLNSAKKEEIAKMAQGNSVVHLYSHQLSSLVVSFPTLPEQTKIASFLTSVDKKIAGLKKQLTLLERYKKGVMQKIFSQELRFKPAPNQTSGDENGNEFPDWEEKKLGEIGSISKGVQLNKEFLTNVGEYPCINGGINPSGFTNEFNTPKDTITISEGGNSCGFVNFIKVDFWCGGHCYSLLRINQSFIKDYLFQFLKYNESNIMSLRVGSGLPNIQKKDLNNFIISKPTLSEQQKIASFLSSIDEKTEKCQGQIKAMENWKKGLLQQMFC